MSNNTYSKKKGISYSKWGYFFIAPFFIVYAIFSLYPLINTIYNSFFEYFKSGLKIIGPNYVGLDNYATIFAAGDQFIKYAGNTLIIWLICFIPQMFFALLFASWFTDIRLKLKATSVFKTIIYLPNLIMAAAMSMLFFALFSLEGPVNAILIKWGIVSEAYNFLASVSWTRGLIAFINFLMWYGNTTIVLMAAIMGIDPTLYESAQIDGANSSQTFWKITIPLIRPILVYVIITALIGGLQMFDIPNIMTNTDGNPNRTSMTLVMYLNNHLYSKNYGLAGAVSVILFIVGALLSMLVIYLGRDKDAVITKKNKTKGVQF